MGSARERLQADLREAEGELQKLDQRLEQRPEFGPGKGNPRAYSWEMELARRKRVMARIDALREALAREREGAYGSCERCARPISPERLDILPTTTLCVSCARAATSDPAFRSADGAHGAIQK